MVATYVMPIVLRVSRAIRMASVLPFMDGCPAHLDILSVSFGLSAQSSSSSGSRCRYVMLVNLAQDIYWNYLLNWILFLEESYISMMSNSILFIIDTNFLSFVVTRALLRSWRAERKAGLIKLSREVCELLG